MKRSRNTQAKLPNRLRTKRRSSRKGSNEVTNDDSTMNNLLDGTESAEGRTTKENLSSLASVEDGTEMERPSSPDPNCSICLCKMDDKSFTHSCFHMFCFTCLLEWSKVKAVCPLCKQPFKSIIHNVRSESDYDVYDLKDNISAPSAATENVTADLVVFSDSSERHMSLPYLSPIVIQSPFFNTAPPTWLQFPSVLFSGSDMRRRIYQTGRRAREIRLPDGMSYRDVSPTYFASNADSDHVRRLIIWLNRELGVLLLDNFDHRRFLQELIINLLEHLNIMSEDFFQHLYPFLGEHTRLFIHELHNFARSPLSITDTDQLTVYEDMQPHSEVEVITVDRDDSDVEIVFPSETIASNRSKNGTHQQRENLSNSCSRFIRSSSSQAEEIEGSPVAGPSGLPGGSSSWSLDKEEDKVQEVSDSDSSQTSIYDNEIMFVGFDKPWRARTPISLSSDGSDVEVDDGLDGSLTLKKKSCLISHENSQFGSQGNSETGCACEASLIGIDDGNSPIMWSELSCNISSEKSNQEHFKKCCCFCFPNDRHSFHSDNDFHEDCASLHADQSSFQKNQCSHHGSHNINACNHFHDKQHLTDKHFGSHSKHHIAKSKTNVAGKLKAHDCHETELLVENNRWSLAKNTKKRDWEDDCADSGVVVDVEGFGDLLEPHPKKSSFKKHDRGHKRSLERLEKLNCKDTQTVKDSVTLNATEISPAELNDNGGSGGSESLLSASLCGSADEIGCLSAESGDCQNQQLSGSSFNFQTKDENVRVDRVKGKVISASGEPVESTDWLHFVSALTCDQSNNVDSDILNQGTCIQKMDVNQVCKESESSSAKCIQSSILHDVCDIDTSSHYSMHSVNSIDSNDSVLWLDSDIPEEQCEPRISICSDVSLLFSPVGSTDVYQLSDEDDECKHDPCRSGILIESSVNVTHDADAEKEDTVKSLNNGSLDEKVFLIGESIPVKLSAVETGPSDSVHKTDGVGVEEATVHSLNSERL